MNFTSSPFERMMKEVPHPGWDNDDPCKGCRYYKEYLKIKRSKRQHWRYFCIISKYSMDALPIKSHMKINR